MSSATKDTMQFAHFAPTIHALLYAFLSLKKAFTPSHGVCFLLIFRGFKCEGLKFQVFTA